jgi:hypothetical protein
LRLSPISLTPKPAQKHPVPVRPMASLGRPAGLGVGGGARTGSARTVVVVVVKNLGADHEVAERANGPHNQVRV